MKLLFPLACLLLFVCSEAKPAADAPKVPVPEVRGPKPKNPMNARKQKAGYYPMNWHGGNKRYGPRPKVIVCQDIKKQKFCQRVLKRNMCHKKGKAKRCKMTCGLCKEATTCVDFGFNCFLASPFLCTAHWFAPACMKSCGLCPIQTTQAPLTTRATTESEDCDDISFNCRWANDYSCARYTFQMGCQKSCGKCTPKTTPPASTTTTAVKTSTAMTTAETTTTAPNTTTPIMIRSTESSVSPTKESEQTEATATSAEIKGTEANATQPKPCVDKDPKNCPIWESLGLCYNPDFADNMKETCPISCKVCEQ